MDRRLHLSLGHVGLGEIAVGLEQVGLERQRALDMGDGLARLVLRYQHGAEAAVRLGVIRSEREDVAVTPLGFGERAGVMALNRGAEQVGKVWRPVSNARPAWRWNDPRLVFACGSSRL